MRLCGLLIFLLTAAAWACPFCSPAEADLFSELEDSLAVVVVEKVEARKYRVLKSLKGQVKSGRIVLAAEPKGRTVPGASLVLTTAGTPTLPYWSDAPRYLDQKELEFVQQSLVLAGGAEGKKWDFAARHLESSSREIALSAYSLLANAPLSEVQARAQSVGIERLRTLARGEKVPPERRALYLLMVYPKLGSSDLGWLEKALFSPSLPKASPMLGPLVVSYLSLGGPEVLPKVQKRFLAPDLPAARTLPVTRALTLIGESSQDAGLKQAVRKAFLEELDSAKRGGFVIAPLAVWGVYEAAPKVEALVKLNPQVTWVKVAAIRFFRSFDSAAAREALGRLARSDANLVQRTTDAYQKDDLGIQ